MIDDFRYSFDLSDLRKPPRPKHHIGEIINLDSHFTKNDKALKKGLIIGMFYESSEFTGCDDGRYWVYMCLIIGSNLVDDWAHMPYVDNVVEKYD